MGSPGASPESPSIWVVEIEGRSRRHDWPIDVLGEINGLRVASVAPLDCYRRVSTGRSTWPADLGPIVAKAIAGRCAVSAIAIANMHVCMARVNVYLPDDLAERARSAGVNVSGVAQDAIRGALASLETDVWLDRLERVPQIELPHEAVITALGDARDEFGA